MAKKFIPAGIEVQRHLDAFVHVGCISRVFKNAGIDPHRTKGKEHRVYSKDGKTYWLLFDVLCHGFLTEFNINGRYLRAVLERPSLNLYILDITLYDPPRMGKGGSKHGRNEERIRRDRKKNKAKKTHRRRK